MMCTTVLHGGVCHRTSTPHKRMKEKKSRRDSWQFGMSHADTDEDDVSLACVLKNAVGRAVCCVFTVFGR